MRMQEFLFSERSNLSNLSNLETKILYTEILIYKNILDIITILYYY